MVGLGEQSGITGGGVDVDGIRYIYHPAAMVATANRAEGRRLHTALNRVFMPGGLSGVYARRIIGCSYRWILQTRSLRYITL